MTVARYRVLRHNSIPYAAIIDIRLEHSFAAVGEYNLCILKAGVADLQVIAGHCCLPEFVAFAVLCSQHTDCLVGSSKRQLCKITNRVIVKGIASIRSQRHDCRRLIHSLTHTGFYRIPLNFNFFRHGLIGQLYSQRKRNAVSADGNRLELPCCVNLDRSHFHHKTSRRACADVCTLHRIYNYIRITIVQIAAILQIRGKLLTTIGYVKGIHPAAVLQQNLCIRLYRCDLLNASAFHLQ